MTGAILFVVLDGGAPTTVELTGSSVSPGFPIATGAAPLVTAAGIAFAAPLPAVTMAESTTGIGVLENEGAAVPKGSFDLALVRISVTCNGAARDVGQEFGVALLVHAPHVIGYGEGVFPCRKEQATVDVRVRVGVDQTASKGHWFGPGAATVFGRVFVGGRSEVAVGPAACTGPQPGSSARTVGALGAGSSAAAPPSARRLVRVANRGFPIRMAPRRTFDTARGHAAAHSHRLARESCR